MAVEQTLTAAAWTSTCVLNPQTEGRLTKTALEALASVKRTPIRLSNTPRAEHWPHGGRPMSGTMWLGVVQPSEAYLDPEGCWTIQTQSPGAPAAAYMRITPAGEDDEVQYGFCPIKLDRRDVMLGALFPGGEVLLNQCDIRVEASSYIRLDKIAITAARLNEECTDEGRSFRVFLSRLRISLGDLIEDLFRNVYSDRTGSVLLDRSADYRGIVHLLVSQGYTGTFPPSSTSDVNRFLACVRQEAPYSWTTETIFPSMGIIVLPAETCRRVARNLEEGLPPIIPQWCTPVGYQFNGPWHLPCTGIEAGGREDKLIAGVCNSFNTDLMGPLSYWPPEWTPHPDWIQAYMDVLDEARTVAMPVDTARRTDMVLELARKVPVILYDSVEPSYARVISFNFSRSRAISDIVIREATASGVLLPERPASSEETEAENPGVVEEDDEETHGTCDHCDWTASDGFAACSNCGDGVCESCWDGPCAECGLELCAQCAEEHGCEESDDE